MKGLILWRCRSPYHRHQWQTCLCAGWTVAHPRVSPFLLPTFHQFSTLEKIIFRQYFILGSLMSRRPSQVSPLLDAAHSTSPEVLDFQMWFSSGFLMQQTQARQDPLRCIAIPNSSSASTLLWLFLHLRLLVLFSTFLQDNWWNWNGWSWINTKMIPFITCEISLCQYVCELVFGVNVFDLDLGVQIDSIKQPIKSNSVTSGNMSHCRASSLYDHLDQCFVVFKDIHQSSWREEWTFEERKSTLSRSSFHEISFALEVSKVLHEPGSCTGFLSVKNWDDQSP